jgi:hypothetical protein
VKVPELQRLQEQHSKAVAEVEQEASAKIIRINQQYVRSLDTLMQQLTRAGNLDAALAVRDEKNRIAADMGTVALPEAKNSKPEPGTGKPLIGIAKPPTHPGLNKIVEGEGWRGFRVGATRDELIKEFGKPDEGSDNRWLQWKRKYSIHCLVDDARGAFELRFDQGFKGETTAGITFGSALKKTLTAYGEPSSQEDRGQAKKLIWSSRGILIWFNEDKVAQIVVFPKG